MCSIWETGREGLPLSDIRDFFARSNRFSWIDVTGGEIFLRDDLSEIFATILGECRELALLHFPTNGYLVDRIVEVTRDLLRRKPPRLVVTVSIDGPPEVHDASRGMEGSFECAVETFARLRAMPGCTCVFGLTIASGNMGTIAETLDALRRRGLRVTAADLHVNLPNQSAHYYRNEGASRQASDTLARELRGIRRLRGVSLRPLAVLEGRLLALGERFLRTGRCPVPCQALAASCFVGVDGGVFPCVTWTRPIGTLAEFGHDLGKLWGSPDAVAARREISAGRCPQCWTACEAVPALAARWGRLRP
jgi:MoaA/NifB/PqqE/SkfB family radical SAM enzyme